MSLHDLHIKIFYEKNLFLYYIPLAKFMIYFLYIFVNVNSVHYLAKVSIVVDCV